MYVLGKGSGPNIGVGLGGFRCDLIGLVRTALSLH